MFKIARTKCGHTRWNELSPDSCVLATDQAGALIRQVIESGDELCTASKEMLQEALALMGQRRDSESVSSQPGVDCGATEVFPWSMTPHSELGGGNGNGQCPSDLELDGDAEGDWLLDLCSAEEQIGSGTNLEPSGSLTNSHPDTLPGHAASLHRDQHEATCPGGCFVADTDRHSNSLSVEELHAWVAMSSNAMAQVDVATGTLVWTNEPFDRLMMLVGGGDALKGKQVLFQRFLQGLPREERRIQNSVTRVIGSPGHEKVLWVINTSEWPMEPQVQTDAQTNVQTDVQGYVQEEKPAPPTASPPANRTAGPADDAQLSAGSSLVLARACQYPAAAEYPDPSTRVLVASPDRHKKPVVLMWQCYGRKLLQVTGQRPVAPEDRLVRRYYRCFSGGCPAKLTVDVTAHLGATVAEHPSGTHDHCIWLETPDGLG
eukprot:TRINITY_DN9181_c0_g1_i1.p1 TRINITY_DN9181_c0_g1~~TRINITY_DN9181_c0_g1_i1.p1  ORF type:complete len:432 (-),score=69.81 TRINITY_DN9181_c0_g1_i1:150-1445(-)